jgi:hypothetical protein
MATWDLLACIALATAPLWVPVLVILYLRSPLVAEGSDDDDT